MSIQSFRCVVCQETITEQEHNYSIEHYKMPLCRPHQKIQKIAQSRQSDSEQNKDTKVLASKTTTKVNEKVIEKPVQNEPIPEKAEDTLVHWLIQWAAARPINLSVESKHFFVEGMRLEEFARDVIGKAKDEILVTSPFLDSCFLATPCKKQEIDEQT